MTKRPCRRCRLRLFPATARGAFCFCRSCRALETVEARWRVRLSRDEIVQAGHEGVARHAAEVASLTVPPEHPARHFGDHVNGAIAELAVCRAFGVRWEPLELGGSVDVPALAADVRLRLSHASELILLPSDDDARRVIAVSWDGRTPVWALRGWGVVGDLKALAARSSKTVPSTAVRLVPFSELEPIGSFAR